jgi:YgiT-type zinc finger domain-containing protein
MTRERPDCSVCGTALEEKTITYTQTIGEQVYIVTDVPALICPIDGEQYLAPEVVDAIQAVIERGRTPKKTIEVPIYEYSQATA